MARSRQFISFEEENSPEFEKIVQVLRTSLSLTEFDFIQEMKEEFDGRGTRQPL
jgi:hypothetical protein